MVSRNALFFRCGATQDLLATLQVNPGQPTPFFASVSTLAVLALPPTIALTRTSVLVIIGRSERKRLKIQLIFIGKWRHRRLDYLSAQQSIAVKDAQRGEANSLTDLLGCATSHPEITEDIRR